MSDKVLVEGLQIDTVIGVYEWEKSIQQRLVLDLEMFWNNRPAGRSDELADALDYATVSETVTTLVQSRPRQLIEMVAEEVAAHILTTYAVIEVTVKVAKPGAVPSAKQVAVVITRQQEAS